MSILRSPTLAKLALVGLALGSAPLAQAADPTPAELNDKIDALDQQVKILNRKLELANDAAAAKGGTAAAGDGSVRPVANEKDGFGIVSADGNTKIKFWGYLQVEGRTFFSDDQTKLTDQILVRRARPVVEGTVAKYWDFRIMPEFGGNTPNITDAYIIGNFDPRVKIEAGRFKVPVGLEFVQNDTVTLFIERGYTSQLVPARDEGVQVFGDVFGGVLSYNLGVFNGGVDNANRDGDNADDKDAVARILTAPFKGGPAALANLTFGVAATFGEADGTNAVVSNAGANAGGLNGFVTAGQNAFAAYTPGTTANGRHTHIVPQAYWSWGPAEILAEYAASNSTLSPVSGAGVTGARTSVSNRAYVVEAGYILTGESASYKGWSPNTAFSPDFSSWGGFQVVGRVEHFALDDRAANFLTATSNRFATGFGVGINWLLNRNVKLVLNYEHTTFDSGRAGVGDREAENLIESRLQLVF